MSNNAQNLIPNSERSPEELREQCRNGGVKSGEARRRKRMLQDALQKALSSNYKVEDKEDVKELGGYDAISISMIQQAISGNVKAATFIRDTIGEKPAEMMEVNSANLEGIQVKFVDKSIKTRKREEDPKIVGEYTNPVDVEEE